MSYQINYTDKTNPLKPQITVNDQSVNTITDLTFIGDNFPNYGALFSENFLYLLENFANSTAPTKPIQGELWYDNSPNNNNLNVYDGVNWKSVSNITKSANAPTNPSTGDLWYKTSSNELYIYIGSNNWTLLNSNNSSTTGMMVKTIVDNNSTNHSIIELYSNTNLIAIISDSSFVPASSISGFTNINAGITLGNNYSISAICTNSLQLGGIVASKYVRIDQVNNFSKHFNIYDVQGINIGNDLGLSLTRNGINSNSDIDIMINNTSLIHVDNSNKIGLGLGNTSPISDVDIKGTLTTDILNIRNTTDNSITSVGGITLAGNANVYNAHIGGNITINGGDIYPLLTNSNIGRNNSPFNNIYGNTIYGKNFIGKFVGDFSEATVSKANTLTTGRNISISGDISSNGILFDGSSDIILSTNVSSGLITNRQNVSDSRNSDILLISRNNVLYQTTKQTFFSTVSGTIQVGMIFPFAGSTIPTGYLLCDGSEVSKSTYLLLYNVIGSSYSEGISLVGTNTFRLPDLRGRFPLGANNMQNSSTVVSVQSSSVNNVTASSAQNIGGTNGSQNLTALSSGSGVRNVSDSNILNNNVMNPYQTINYIIYTGNH